MQIPEWAEPFIGIRFMEGGRDVADGGLDCYGLVRLVAWERFGIEMPDLSITWGSRADTRKVEKFIDEFDTTSIGWASVTDGSIETGDILFLYNGGRCHVGIVVAPGQFLHVDDETDSVVESYRSMSWRSRLLGVYRYEW